MNDKDRGPQIETTAEGKTVNWVGEGGLRLQAEFGLAGGQPVIRALRFDQGQGWQLLAEGLRPEFEVTTGMRRGLKNQPEPERWWNYSDNPLTHPEEAQTAQAAFACARIEARLVGARAEIAYPGVTAGQFAGEARFTVYQGSNLLRVELAAHTEQDSVAYMYRAGLGGFRARELSWVEPQRNPRRHAVDIGRDPAPVRVRARNRLLTAALPIGSVACFPPPHAFFWDRQREINVGFNYYRRDGESVALGVRHNEESEYPLGQPNPRPWELYNARPGTVQRMSAFYYLAAGDADACRRGALAYTRGDHYQRVPGYMTLAAHFHLAFWQAYRDGNAAGLAWINVFKELGVDLVHVQDFHSDAGHPKESGPMRLEEQRIYFEACRVHSDAQMLIIPGEEPNQQVGGHWAMILPRPIYYTNQRAADQPFMEEVAPYGRVYHVGGVDDLLRLLELEGGAAWTTHPRTKSSIGYPDAVKDTALFRSRHWLGASFSYLPADLSFLRLLDDRCELVLDDMNQWAAPKYMLAEVDTYGKDGDYDLYGDFAVNYVKIGQPPERADWTGVSQALLRGNFNVSTGEVLIHDCRVTPGEVIAEIEWTFPLEFVEVIWGAPDGVKRKMVSAADLPPFGKKEFRLAIPKEARWARFAAWDCAMNGAFAQPVALPVQP